MVNDPSPSRTGRTSAVAMPRAAEPSNTAIAASVPSGQMISECLPGLLAQLRRRYESLQRESMLGEPSNPPPAANQTRAGNKL